MGERKEENKKEIKENIYILSDTSLATRRRGRKCKRSDRERVRNEYGQNKCSTRRVKNAILNG